MTKRKGGERGEHTFQFESLGDFGDTTQDDTIRSGVEILRNELSDESRKSWKNLGGFDCSGASSSDCAEKRLECEDERVVPGSKVHTCEYWLVERRKVG